MIFFYYNNESYIEDIVEVEDDYEKESKITITNEDELLNDDEYDLEYNIYRGDTRKSAVYFYVNDDKIYSLRLSKYGITSGKINIKDYLKLGENEIVITGLDEEEKISFMVNDEVYIENKEKKSFIGDKNFYISDFYLEKPLIFFDLNSDLKDYNTSCYVSLSNTIVSNELIFFLDDKRYELNLSMNNSKLIEKGFEENEKLKLICKYKRSTYFKYASLEFDYEIIKNEKNNQLDSQKIVLNYYNRNPSNFNLSEEVDKIKLESNLSLNENKNLEIKSSNIKVKEKSFILFGVVLILLIVILILNW